MNEAVGGYKVCLICHYPIAYIDLRYPPITEITNQLCSTCTESLKGSVALIGAKINDDNPIPYKGYRFVSPEFYKTHFKQDVSSETIIFIDHNDLTSLPS